jgi:hypothetical protein
MKSSDHAHNNRLLQLAASTYLVPRAAKAILLVVIVGLAAFLVLVSVGIGILQRFAP